MREPDDTEKTYTFGLDKKRMSVRELKGTVSLKKAISYIIGELETPPEIGDKLNVKVLYQDQSGKINVLTKPTQVYEVTQLYPFAYQIIQGKPNYENQQLYEFIPGLSPKQSRDTTFLVELVSESKKEESLEIEVEEELTGDELLKHPEKLHIPEKPKTDLEFKDLEKATDTAILEGIGDKLREYEEKRKRQSRRAKFE